MTTPEESRRTIDAIQRAATNLVNTAMSIAGNDKERNLMERRMVNRLYRDMAIREANRLLYDLKATEDERKVLTPR